MPSTLLQMVPLPPPRSLLGTEALTVADLAACVVVAVVPALVLRPYPHW